MMCFFTDTSVTYDVLTSAQSGLVHSTSYVLICSVPSCIPALLTFKLHSDLFELIHLHELIVLEWLIFIRMVVTKKPDININCYVML